MKLGVFTALLQDRPLEDVLRVVAHLGYEMIELPAWRGAGLRSAQEAARAATAGAT